MACFSAGFQRRDPWLFVFFVLLQFHVGIRMTPITEARTGFFDPTKALIAIRRGAAMNVDLNNGWEYWPVMGEQVEELRRRYNILPAEAFYPANFANTLRETMTVMLWGSTVRPVNSRQGTHRHPPIYRHLPRCRQS